MRLIALGLALALGLMAAPALATPVKQKISPHSVAATIDRLAAAIEGVGATVFARIDHAEGAASVGTELRPTTLLIFGNPAIGSPMMAASQTMGIDLPMKALAYEDETGQVHLIYSDIEAIAAEHGATAPTTAKAKGALEKLTDKAVAAE